MGKIIEYKLIKSSNMDSVFVASNNLISMGFQPFGPCQISMAKNQYSTDVIFLQTMVKYNND